MSNQGVAVRLFAIVLAGIAVSYLLARAGEPQSVWLWRDILKLVS